MLKFNPVYGHRHFKCHNSIFIDMGEGYLEAVKLMAQCHQQERTLPVGEDAFYTDVLEEFEAEIMQPYSTLVRLHLPQTVAENIKGQIP